MSKFCINCGAEIEDDSVFCDVCGFKLESASQSEMEAESGEVESYREENPENTGSDNHQKTSARRAGGRKPKRIIGAVLLLTSVVSAVALPVVSKKGETNVSGKVESENNKEYITAADEENTLSAAEKDEEADVPDNMNEAAEDTTPQGLDRENKEEYSTVSGGDWDQAGDLWFYVKDDEIVIDSWIEDNGKYYFVDSNGYMLTDCYTPDGYYVGADGAYDPDSDNGIVDMNDENITTVSENGAEIAAALSTSDIAYALDFEWFIDYVMNGGHEAGSVITDVSMSSEITEDADSLNGGWKAFMFTEDGTYGSDVERYFNAEIDTDGNDFNLTCNWKYFFDPTTGSSVDESHTDRFEGTFSNGTASAQSSYAKVDFDKFYLSKDGKAEYAVGTFYWISGEIDRIGLMRRAK